MLDIFKDDLDCDVASNNFGHVNDAIGGTLPDPPYVHDLTDMYSERAVWHINVPLIHALKISCISDVTVSNHWSPELISKTLKLFSLSHCNKTLPPTCLLVIHPNLT